MLVIKKIYIFAFEITLKINVTNNKKWTLLFAMTVFIAMAATSFVGCKKEKDKEETMEVAQLSEFGNIDEYLISFKKKLLSTAKGEDLLTVDVAQRDLGNLLNFDFGDANYLTDEMRYDTLHVSLELIDGLVDMSQLAETYNNAFNELLATFNQVELPGKSVFSVLCNINANDKNRQVADVQLVLTTRGKSDSSVKIGFDVTDNWRVGEQLGKCDGTCVGDDHVTMLKKVYENNRPFLAAEHGRVYYSDISVDNYIYSDSFHESNPDVFYNYGFRLWCGTGSEVINNCIGYAEMQYYYNNLCQILSNEAYKPQGHVVKSIVNCSLEPYVSVNPELFYSFCCQYETAKPNYTYTELSY